MPFLTGGIKALENDRFCEIGDDLAWALCLGGAHLSKPSLEIHLLIPQ